MATTFTFNNDIRPLFSKWKTMMTWRLDLENYEHVKANAGIIYYQISIGNMPPPNIATLTQEQIDMFKAWMDNDCPEK